MLDPSTETNPKTPENPGEPNKQANPNDQAQPNDQANPNSQAQPNNQANPNDQAQPSNQAEPNDQDEPNDQANPNDQDELINEDEMPPEGFWAKLSAEQKRWIMIGAAALAAVVLWFILSPSHKTPETAKKAPAPAPTEAQIVANAEQIATSAPSPENYVNLSAAYYNAKRYGECILASRKAISLKPDLPEAYNNIAAGFLQLSMWDSAIVSANEAIRLKPDFQLAKNNLAAAIDGKKKLAESIVKLTKETSDQPTAEKYLELSAAYFQDNEFDKCIAAARKAIALRPDFGEAYNNICVAYNRLGRFADGKKAGEEAVRLAPNNQLAKNNLKWSTDELNKKDGKDKKESKE
jgi:Flp pilus assembly protein TadD